METRHGMDARSGMGLLERMLDRLLRRPVAVQAATLGLLAVAVYTAFRLPVSLLPSLAYPAVAVWTAYPDASPEKVERAVTEPIEESLAGITELRRIESRSQLGGSLVRLDFAWGTDLDLARLEIRRQLDRLVAALPERAERPVLVRLDPSQRPLMVIALSLQAPATTAEDLTTLREGAAEVVARRLEQIEGVARARIGGGHRRLVEVEVEESRLATHGLELADLRRGLEAANVELAGGRIQQGPFRYAVEIQGQLASGDDVGAVVVSQPGEPTVRLRQVATVRSTLAERRGLVRLDGREILALLVERRPDSNAVETAARVRRSLAELSHELPGVLLDTVVDESTTVRGALGGVGQALAWGGVLAIVVLFLFLRRWRVLAAMAVSIPLSLALSLLLFDLLGVTLNLLSLSGLALGIGLLVDNAIVVVENISRLREAGLTPHRAASRGAAEVAPAITASTLTTLAVFLPLGLTEGLAGRLFHDQALAVVCSLLASLLVAVTVVPMVARGAASRAFDARAFEDRRDGAAPNAWVRRGEAWVGASLRRRGWVALTALLMLAGGAVLALQVPREVVPASEQGRLEIEIALPADAGLDWLDERSAELEATLAGWPEVERVLADLGERDDASLEIDPRPPYAADLTVILAPGATTDSVLARLAQWSRPDDLQLTARAVRSELETLLDRSDADLVVELVGDRRERAETALGPLVTVLEDRPELTNVVPEAGHGGIPAVRLVPRREAISRHGVRPEALGAVVESAARGVAAGDLQTGGRDHPIRLVRPLEGGLTELMTELVPAAAGLVPLGALVTGERVEIPAVLARRDRAPVVRLRVDIAPGVGLEAAEASLQTALARLPTGVSGRVVGANEAFRQSLLGVGWTLALSLLLVYLLLAAQFESLVQPLVVVSVVPLALAGVAVVLWVTGGSWNLMSLTGCVVLLGIAVNDAIVKVDFVNRARRRGLDLDAALRRAGQERIRPVLMTTATTVLGLLPLALGWGEGAALRSPVAVVILGGLMFSTAITLTVVPVVYRALVSQPMPSAAGHASTEGAR